MNFSSDEKVVEPSVKVFSNQAEWNNVLIESDGLAGFCRITHQVVLSPAFTDLVLIKNLPSFENCPMFAAFGLKALLLKISSNPMFCAFETVNVPQNRRERKSNFLFMLTNSFE